MLRKNLATIAKKNIVFNSSRERLSKENEAFAKSIPKGALVLDAGAGKGPCRRMFKHARYESADIMKIDKEYEKPTYVCDLKSIPVEDCRFDFVVFNQVLEHVPEPKEVLAELYRVLKPEGKLIYTGPLFYEEHEQPYDFYRYTQFGLKYLFDQTGFSVERLDWLEGYFGTVGYQLSCMSKYLPLKVSGAYMDNCFLNLIFTPFMLLLKISFFVLSIAFHRLEIIYKFTEKGYPKNYISILIKN